MALVVPLVVVALLSYYILHLSAQPSPVDRFWINGDDGVDNSTCGPAGSPCKSLFYVVNEIYRDNNLSYVEIELQSNLLYETCEVTHAFLSTVIIHINGNENTIKASTISIPKVEYTHTWVDSSILSGHIASFTYCTITHSVVYGQVEQEDALQPELTLYGCRMIDSNTTFHTLNISNTQFLNSPISTPIDGSCDITQSNFTATIGSTALSCGSASITNSVFSENQGLLGGAINIFQFAYIGDSVISKNSAEYGGGIYSQGTISLDNVEITENTASQGGGLYFYGPQTDLECVDTVIIENNEAEMGGGLFVMSNEFTSNTETLGQLCVLTGNSAKSSGGAIYVNDSSVSISYFLVSNNTATIGAGVYSSSSLLNLTSVTVTGNAGGGVHFVDSPVVLTTTKFTTNADTHGLHNSSSFITSWDRVVVSSSNSFVCDDCAGKLCSAGSSCSDCRSSCMTMGTTAVCIESHFGCIHGTCDLMKDQSPECTCNDNYTGELCDEHMPLSSQWENTIFIMVFAVGCTITIALVVALIIRLHRHRAGYQPILSYSKLVAQNSNSNYYK